MECKGQLNGKIVEGVDVLMEPKWNVKIEYFDGFEWGKIVLMEPKWNVKL